MKSRFVGKWLMKTMINSGDKYEKDWNQITRSAFTILFDKKKLNKVLFFLFMCCLMIKQVVSVTGGSSHEDLSCCDRPFRMQLLHWRTCSVRPSWSRCPETSSTERVVGSSDRAAPTAQWCHVGLCKMQKKSRKETESLRSPKASPDDGISRLSKRDKRRLHLKWRFHAWRSWNQKCWFYRRQRTGSGSGSGLYFSSRSHVQNGHLLGCPETKRQNSEGMNLGSVCSESDSLPEEPVSSTRLPPVSVGTVSPDTRRRLEDVAELREAGAPQQQTDSNTWESQKAHTPEDNTPLELHSSVHSGQNQNPNDAVCWKKASCRTDVDPDTLTSDIQGMSLAILMFNWFIFV